MIVKDIQDETLQDYKVVSMLISACSCDWKCCSEAGMDICQNSELAQRKDAAIPNKVICRRYLHNPISKAIIFGGLEPMLQLDDVLEILSILRHENNCLDDVVIYTGYNEAEVADKLKALRKYKNIIVKFGRYRPNDTERYDEILGINLASSNQYAKKIS